MCLSFFSFMLLVLLEATLAKADDCYALRDMYIPEKAEISDQQYNMDDLGIYFCADTAPELYRCTCSKASVCTEMLDPWGRDLGECLCCPVWLTTILLFFTVVVVAALIMCAYAAACRGMPWCDGYPTPVQPPVPRRGVPIVIPATLPLPPTLFRGYRSTDFTSAPPGMLLASREEVVVPRSFPALGQLRTGGFSQQPRQQNVSLAGARSYVANDVAGDNSAPGTNVSDIEMQEVVSSSAPSGSQPHE